MTSFVYPHDLVFDLEASDQRRGVIRDVALRQGLPVAEQDGRLHITIGSPQQAYQFGQFCGRVFQEMRVLTTPLPEAPSPDPEIV